MGGAGAGSRQHGPEVHAERQVPDADRQAQQRARAATTWKTCRLPAKTLVDPKTNELYVADGYGNRRVIVFDADTGKYKRHWGAYGHKPDDTQLPPYNPDDPPAQQFRTPVHCAGARQRRPAVRLRPHQRSHPGVQDRRHVT